MFMFHATCPDTAACLSPHRVRPFFPLGPPMAMSMQDASSGSREWKTFSTFSDSDPDSDLDSNSESGGIPASKLTNSFTLAFTLNLIKSAVCAAAASASTLNMSESDLGLCVAAQLREDGVRVAHEYAIVPHWITSRGTRVPLSARRADLAVWRYTDKVLVELKMVTSSPARVDDRFKRQAAAYSEIAECPCLLAVVTKGRPGIPAFEEFGAGHAETGVEVVEGI